MKKANRFAYEACQEASPCESQVENGAPGDSGRYTSIRVKEFLDQVQLSLSCLHRQKSVRLMLVVLGKPTELFWSDPKQESDSLPEHANMVDIVHTVGCSGNRNASAFLNACTV